MAVKIRLAREGRTHLPFIESLLLIADIQEMVDTLKI